ncbi:hypothetical protein C1645_827190 [Glomus cerebriforme]|uniref:Uncharacterized protein n=1 Tax=Glomus cerebriforme TaxID=658196 RepID=A0A397SY77_9GLOM|nr:hypothetical protein C1645_827190 [Glomus cerebriforme]
MFIESHWRILKRENSPGQGCYVIVCKLIPKQLDQYYLLCNGRILPSWQKDFKTNWRELASKTVINWNEYGEMKFIHYCVTIWQELGYEQSTNESFIDDPDPDTSLQTGYDRNIEDESCETVINLLNETHHYLDKSTNLPRRDKWLENIALNFNALEQMVHQIKEYEHRKTMPRS